MVRSIKSDNDSNQAIRDGSKKRQNLVDSSPTISSITKEVRQDVVNKSRNNKNFRRQNNRRQSPNKSRFELPPKAQYLALDCEMVGVGLDGQRSSVACVTVIDWHGGIIFHSFIRQTEPVTDYRTFVSGITEKQLQNATMSLGECRGIVSQLLYNRILVGHALQNDLEALQISHPWWLTRDSATYEPFMKFRFDDKILWPRRLKDLANEKLSREIQKAGKPHSAYEDALAAFDLYKSVRMQWESAINKKVQEMNNIHYPQMVRNYKEQMAMEYARLAREQQLFFNQQNQSQLAQ